MLEVQILFFIIIEFRYERKFTDFVKIFAFCRRFEFLPEKKKKKNSLHIKSGDPTSGSEQLAPWFPDPGHVARRSLAQCHIRVRG